MSFDLESNVSTESSDSGIMLEDNENSKSFHKNFNISTTISDNRDSTSKENSTITIENTIRSHEPSATTANKRTSPTVSIRSTNISIVSIDEDYESSVVDSDSDLDHGDAVIVRKLGEQTATGPNVKDLFKGGICDPSAVIIKEIIDGNSSVQESSTSAVRSQIGTIAVQNSSDVTFGNKTFYQGPVTIKQFVVETSLKYKPDGERGSSNPAFDGSGETTDANSGARKTGKDLGKKSLICSRKRTVIIASTIIILLIVLIGLLIYFNVHENRRPDDPLERVIKKRFLINKRAAVSTSVIVVLVAFLSTIMVTIALTLKNAGLNSSKQLGDGDDSRKNIPIDSSIGQDNIGGGTFLRIIAREEWLAQPPSNNLTKLNLPVHRVIIAHTATEGCDNQAKCIFRIRFIQTFHIESRGFDDIAYNFLVGGDGAVYEGRGWDSQGAHTKGFNVDSIGIAFIGTFNKIAPTDKQLQAAQKIIAEGVRLNKLVEDYKLFGHRQLTGFESPGEALFDIIKTWSNWSNELE